MDSLYTNKPVMIRDAAHDFLAECLAPFAAQWDRDLSERPAISQLSKLGLPGMTVLQFLTADGLQVTEQGVSA
jgi:alkylation response protein AidB-like acyl-CoA dehydrogenase